MADFTRVVNSENYKTLVSAVIEGLIAKDIDTKHSSLVAIARIFDINTSGIKVMGIKVDGKMIDTEEMQMPEIVEMIKELERGDRLP